MTGNLLSTLAFFLWVPFALWAMRRLRDRPALFVVVPMLTAAMVLPELVTFKLPGIPAFSKETIATTWVAIGLGIWQRRRLRKLRLGPSVKLIALLIPLGGLGTALTNPDPVVIGPTVLPAMVPWDAVHCVVDDLYKLLLPFVIGAVAIRTSSDARDLFVAFGVAGLAYVPLLIIETRLSPQLHDWVYGFPQHAFVQTLRWGGYRPMVFMNHGLAVALLYATAVVSVATLYRARLSLLGFRAGRCAAFLAWALLLCKTVASLLYGYVGALLAILASPRVQVRVAVALVCCLLFYPLLRGNGFVDADELVEAAGEWTDGDRAQSLEFRLLNEEILLARAVERPVFGWGGFSRACIFDAFSGDELSTRDGAWIIALGERGVIGYLVAFGLLAIPIFLAARRLPRVRGRVERALFAGVALLVGIYAFDLIPNGRYTYFGYFLAGALYGLSAGLPVASRRSAARR